MSGSGVTNANGGIFIESSGDNLILFGRTLNNAAGQTATWTATAGSGGLIALSSGAVFNNHGTFLAQTDQSISGGSGGGTFNNFGTFTRSNNSGTLTTDPDITFNNSGTVNVQTGTLSSTATTPRRPARSI